LLEAVCSSSYITGQSLGEHRIMRWSHSVRGGGPLLWRTEWCVWPLDSFCHV